MIHWLWAVFAFFGGAVFGMFVIAFAEVSRREEKREEVVGGVIE